MPFPSSHEATRTSLAVVWYKFEALALTTLLASLFSYTILFSPCPVSYLIRTSLKEPEFSREKKANPRDYEELVHRAMEVNKSHHLSWASWRLRKASSTIPVWAWQLENQGANSASHWPGLGEDPVFRLGLQSEGMRGKSILPCFLAFLLPCFFPTSLLSFLSSFFPFLLSLPPFQPSFFPFFHLLPLPLHLSFLSTIISIPLFLPLFFPSYPLWLVKDHPD